MKFSKNAKLEKVVDGTRRPSMGAACLQGSRLLATNGYALASVPVELEPGDVDGPVTVEALKASRKGKSWEASIECNGSLKVADGVTYPRPDLGEFPSTEKALEDAKASPKVVRIGLNAKKLRDLADALGASDGRIVLEIEAPDKAVLVWALEAPGALGVIMPVTIEEGKGWK